MRHAYDLIDLSRNADQPEVTPFSAHRGQKTDQRAEPAAADEFDPAEVDDEANTSPSDERSHLIPKHRLVHFTRDVAFESCDNRPRFSLDVDFHIIPS